MEIAPVSNYRCLRRGVSIMRLALGYTKGLPYNWEIANGGLNSKWTIIDEISAILRSFPKHHARIICSDTQAREWKLQRHEYHTGPGRGKFAKFENSHILAISYMHNSYGESHFMIASPVKDMMPFTRYVASVSIREKL